VLGGPADGLDLSVHHALLHGAVERYLDTLLSGSGVVGRRVRTEALGG
jgi:hypothetical protein